MATDVWIELPSTTAGTVTSLNGLTGAVTLAAGSGIALSQAGSTITISNTEAGGTVTSVGLSTPGVLYSVSGSPVTTSGVLALNLINQTANTVLAGPSSGGPGAPSFRALTGTDLGGFTQGSVIFAGASGNLTQDNPNFYWNDTSLSLGLGVIPSTSIALDIVNNSGANKPVQATGYSGNVGFRSRRANGTLASPTASNSGDILGFYSARGYGTTGFAASSTGSINIVADGSGSFTDTSMPTYLQFQVTPVGSVTAAEAMRIAANGFVGIGTTNPTSNLQINVTNTNPAANVITSQAITNTNYSASSSVNTSGFQSILTPSVASTFTASSTAQAIYAFAVVNTAHAGTLTNLDSIRAPFGTSTGSTGTVTNAYGINVLPSNAGGTITNMYSIYLASPTTGGTVTNEYGLYSASTTANNVIAGNTTLSKFNTAGVLLNSSAGLVSSSAGPLAVANGGTGSATQNYVDLTTVQSVAGAKTFTSNTLIAQGTSSVATIGISGTTSIQILNGGLSYTTRTITGNLTVDTTQTDHIIFCNQSGAITVTLPAPTNGRMLYIKDISGTAQTNNITIARHASESIEGIAASFIFKTNWGCILLTSDGTNWFII
jgi:hypothetical protein